MIRMTKLRNDLLNFPHIDWWINGEDDVVCHPVCPVGCVNYGGKDLLLFEEEKN